MKRHSVLVIDDSLTIRGIIESMLEKDGAWELIGPASDIEHARALIAERRPDVITLDLAMPGTGGLAFLDELGGSHHPPVVVVSSSTRADSPEAAEAKRKGAVACFDKARLVAEGPKLMRVLRKAVEQAKRAA
jgi:two-component system chemotaxis response regulator CheB